MKKGVKELKKAISIKWLVQYIKFHLAQPASLNYR